MGFSPPKAIDFYSVGHNCHPKEYIYIFRNFWSETGWSESLKTVVYFTETGMVFFNWLDVSGW